MIQTPQRRNAQTDSARLWKTADRRARDATATSLGTLAPSAWEQGFCSQHPLIEPRDHCDRNAGAKHRQRPPRFAPWFAQPAPPAVVPQASAGAWKRTHTQSRCHARAAVARLAGHPWAVRMVATACPAVVLRSHPSSQTQRTTLSSVRGGTASVPGL